LEREKTYTTSSNGPVHRLSADFLPFPNTPLPELLPKSSPLCTNVPLFSYFETLLQTWCFLRHSQTIDRGNRPPRKTTSCLRTNVPSPSRRRKIRVYFLSIPSRSLGQRSKTHPLIISLLSLNDLAKMQMPTK